jgi:putative ABC transport system permease protein
MLLTIAAIAGGVGFLAGTFVYADTARAAFYGELARSARGVDVVVLPSTDDVEARLPSHIVQAARALPELSAVDGRTVELLGMLDPQGRLITDSGQTGHAVSLPKAPQLAGFDLVAGRLPQRAGEVAIDHSTAQRHAIAVDGPVRLVTDGGVIHDLTVVGLIDFGVRRDLSGLPVAALTDADLTALIEPTGVAELVAQAAPGVDQQRARTAVAAVVPPGYQVLTGDEWREWLAVDAGKYVGGFQRVLLAFSLISLAVSVFVIYNTFSIMTARRQRELALWRCLGAGRTQVRLLVVAEALALGVAGSLLGIAASLVVGWGLITGRGLVATAIPDHPLVLQAGPVLLTLIVGTLTAIAGALLPAWRAGRIAPIDALQVAALHELRPRRRQTLARLAVAAMLFLAGAAAMRHGLPSGFDGLLSIFAGAAVVFSGLILLAPLAVGRLTAIAGWLPARLFGVPARLALGQARHSPRRAAATTSALMVGVGVLATVSVLLATAADQSRRELSENFSVDFKLSSMDIKSGDGKAKVPTALITALRGRAEFAQVTGLRSDLFLVNNSGVYVWAAQELRDGLKPEVTAGSLEGLGPSEAAVKRSLADHLDVQLGDALMVDEVSYRIVAFYDDAPSSAEVLLSWQGFATVGGADEPDEILIALAPGVTTAGGQAVLDDLLHSFPLVQVSSQAQARDDLTKSFDRLLGVFVALLGVSLLIALFGIGNTLALSVWERTRESATLRALGLSRAGLRWMLLLEAVLMAVVGGGAGLVFGGAVGWTAALALIGAYGHGTPVLPVGEFALYLLVAGAAAAISALLPARRAARATIVTALAAE